MPKKIVHKRAASKGVRPDSSYISPGEIALNINSQDPGLFILDSSLTARKVGPTSVSPEQPSLSPSRGELWYDTSKDTLKICLNPSLGFNEVRSKAVTSGGRNVFYVCPADPESSDSFENDGLTLPFRTLNRAAIEVARKSILRSKDDQDFYGKFTIVVLPGTSTVYNSPGKPVSFFTSGEGYIAEGRTSVIPDSLEYFNSEKGGVIIPRGCSVIGLDQYKSEVCPSDPESPLMKLTGGSSLSSLSTSDKKVTSVISSVNLLSEDSSVAIFGTKDSNGLRYGDKISMSVSGISSIPLGSLNFDIFSREIYWVEPLDDKTFLLRKNDPANGKPADYVLSEESFPQSLIRSVRIIVSVTPECHDRAFLASVASRRELSDFYVKVQRSFPSEFLDTYSNHEISKDEVEGDIFLKDINLSSDYGMSLAEFSLVNRAYVSGCLTRISQNRSDIYEVYFLKEWVPAREAYRRSKGYDESEVEEVDVMNYLSSLPPNSKRLVKGRGSFGILAKGGGISVTVSSCSFYGHDIPLVSQDGAYISAGTSNVYDGEPLSEGFSKDSPLKEGVSLLSFGVPRKIESWLADSNVNYIRTNMIPSGSLDESEISYDSLPISEEPDTSPYRLLSGDWVWAKKKSDGSWLKAQLQSDYVPGSLELRLVKEGNGFSGQTISDIYLRRYKEERPWYERKYHLVLDSEVPVGSMMEFGVDNEKVHPGSSLSDESGVGQIFRVTECHKVSDTKSYVSLKLFDYVRPYLAEKVYSLGDLVSKEGRVYELTDKGWLLHDSAIVSYDEPFDVVKQRPRDSLLSIGDKDYESYTQGDSYVRGLPMNSGRFELVVDGDDGVSGIGVLDKEELESKETVLRLIHLLGYETFGDGSDPLPEGSRGYALSNAPWPLKFLKPSMIETVVPGRETYGGLVTLKV